MIPITQNNRQIAFESYEPQRLLRLIIIAAIAGAILIPLGCTGYLTIQNSIATWKILVGVGATVVTMGAVARIICLANQNLASGKLFGSEHWKKCYFTENYSLYAGFEYEAYLDLSPCAEGGRARLYTKSPKNATITGGLSLVFTPLYAGVVMVYNLIRSLMIPFYIGWQMHKHPEIGFRLSDIPKEMAFSVGRVIQAPFFAIAFMFASFYVLIDPLNGIKLGSAIEYEWNKHVPMRDRGIWLVAREVFREWQWEGGGTPEHLGENGFYFAGSWLPIREFPIVNNAVQQTWNGIGNVELTEVQFN